MNKKLLYVVSGIILVGNCYAASLGKSYENTFTTNSTAHATRLLASSTNINTNYTAHTKTNEAGVSITEYVDTNNKVFAVTWQGATNPNLEEILGNYFQDYVKSNQVKSLHSNNVMLGDLVVKNSGHVRAFKGVAYLKSMLPANFNVQEIY